MSTINGFGTVHYDWVHHPDGTSETTRWLVAMFFPVLPLERIRLVVVTQGEKPSFFSIKSTEESFQVQYYLLGPGENSPRRILATYFKGWLLAPLVLFGPAVALILLLRRFDPEGKSENLALGCGLGMLVYFGFVVATILERSKGLGRKPLPEELQLPGEVYDP